MDTLLALVRAYLGAYFNRTALEDVLVLKAELAALFPQLDEPVSFSGFRDSVRSILNALVRDASRTEDHLGLAAVFWGNCQGGILKWRPKFTKPLARKRKTRQY